MWYVEDIRSRDTLRNNFIQSVGLTSETFDSVSKVFFKNSETGEIYKVNFDKEEYYLFDMDIRFIKGGSFKYKHGMKFIQKHKKDILGVSNNCFKIVTMNDVKLLSLIDKPKLIIKRNLNDLNLLVSLPPKRGELTKTLFMTGTLLQKVIESKKFGLKLIEIDDNYIYVPVDAFFDFKYVMYYRFKIKDIKKFNSFITKIIVLGVKYNVQSRISQ